MNALEIVGVLALAYLAAGTICAIVTHISAPGMGGWLSTIVITFVHVMCWPVVLAAAFEPDIGRVLDDPVASEGGATGERLGPD